MHKTPVSGITLIGTAHISKRSIAEVRQVIAEEHPTTVAVELCKSRYQAITNKKRWEQTSITKIIKENKWFLVLSQLILAMLQRQMSKEGIRPGAEMLAGLNIAKKQGIKVALVDRDITITLQRAWAQMGIIEKIRLFWYSMVAVFGWDRLKEESKEMNVDALLDDTDLITEMMKELRKVAPNTTKTLIDERDAYLAKKIMDAKKRTNGKVVAIVGAGHLNGIVKYIKNPKTIPDISLFDKVPQKRFKISTIIGWAIPIFFGATFLYVLLSGEWMKGLQMVLAWIIITGTLAALGAMLAFGHPLTWLTAFIVAPFTTVNPFIAAGWVTGYLEAVLRTPQVKDLQNLSKMETFKEFFGNKFVRVLMVASLTNVGASIGTFIALPYVIGLGLF